MPRERWAISVKGTVQGVGFRPFVYRLANRWKITGLVRNERGSVKVEAEGESPRLRRFFAELQTSTPPVAVIERVSVQPLPLLDSDGFVIEPSDADSPGDTVISPDIATCDACLEELFDPVNRRFRYPFLNCTDCGPRLSIVEGVPYDRERTTMKQFTMCAACRAEYEDAGDRRFHAQATACFDCGPRLSGHFADGRPIDSDDPIAVFVEEILSGRIGALKGLGGYHLVCDARNAEAVGELRRRKHRDEKPFAVMVRDLKEVERLCHGDLQEQELLHSPQRPIVLMRKRTGEAYDLAANVAPDNACLGIMLPYTPLHHLLLADAGVPLVMTSGNRSDEPIAYRDDEAREKLGGIADVFLTHDRPIHVRSDDSVTRIIAGRVSPIRRARGYAPAPIALPVDCPQPILAVGGQLKATFAFGKGGQAVISHHLGDLDNLDAYLAFEQDVGLYEELLDAKPEVIVHDLHPDYASTRYAITRAARENVNLIAVQHHHAHMASCMTENGLNGRVIGVCFDGTGLGPDATIWGGEFLVGAYTRFTRAARLRPVRMPGGEKAIHEPWRMAVSHLADAGIVDHLPIESVNIVEQRAIHKMLEGGFNSPWTSSAGRLFDAVAAIIGPRQSVCYEGQAAQELESLASQVGDHASYPFVISREVAQEGGEAQALTTPVGWKPSESQDVIDTRLMIRAIVQDVRKGAKPDIIARRFHNALVEMIALACGRIRETHGIPTVVLSGGVFQNAFLTNRVFDRLSESGFRVFTHHTVPANDGGLSLGQLAVAAAVLNEKPAKLLTSTASSHT